jgi:hypothetical protein
MHYNEILRRAGPRRPANRERERPEDRDEFVDLF